MSDCPERGESFMRKSFSHKLGRYVYEILAGDFYATREKDVVLGTLLGSCISVAMSDKVTGVVGMNHFMLPMCMHKKEELIVSEDARYGIHAMEMMINGMMKLGARRENLQAKVFGGGHVVDTVLSNVAQCNIDFALTYLEMEQIPVVARDVGGNIGRKLYFFPESFTVYLKRIHYNRTLQEALLREKRFLQWMRKQRHQESELTFFNNGGDLRRNEQ